MQDISAELRKDMEAKGIDVPLSLEILENYNAGYYDEVKPVRAKGVPLMDGVSVIDLRNAAREDKPVFSCDAAQAQENLAAFGVDLSGSPFGKRGSAVAGADALGRIGFSGPELLSIGKAILPFTAYGILNGGSATSYADGKKNLALGKETFEAVASVFASMAPLCRDMPKGVTPAYINPDGSPGASFLELKMRARLLLAAGFQPAKTGKILQEETDIQSMEFLPLFQMTSMSNDKTLADFYEKARSSIFLQSLTRKTGLDPATWLTGIQPMIAAFSHSSEGRPKGIFDKAYGAGNSCIPLPGGHGQCFRVLRSIFTELHERGIRYACLGNVDNLGFTPDPLELAIMAISGRPAAFDFAVRTPMDVKGGILVETSEGGLTVADIGAAISFEAMLDLERKGFPILFNCASGIFDLDYLVPRIEEIARRLPVRFSDQDKDAGKYSQAEQVTWEVTGILPSFIAFAVEKEERFIAAKLLIDTLLTSGVGAENLALPENMRATATKLHAGLASLLRNTYGLELSCGKWTPKELLST